MYKKNETLKKTVCYQLLQATLRQVVGRRSRKPLWHLDRVSSVNCPPQTSKMMAMIDKRQATGTNSSNHSTTALERHQPNWVLWWASTKNIMWNQKKAMGQPALSGSLRLDCSEPRSGVKCWETCILHVTASSLYVRLEGHTTVEQESLCSNASSHLSVPLCTTPHHIVLNIIAPPRHSCLSVAKSVAAGHATTCVDGRCHRILWSPIKTAAKRNEVLKRMIK